MPAEDIWVGLLFHGVGHFDKPPMHGVIIAPVFKFVPYPTANLEMMGRCNCHITPIEQAVNVSTEKKTIRRFVYPLLRVRPNVRRIQRRQRSLAGHSTAPLIIVRHHDAKSALPKTRPDQGRLAPTLRDRYATDKRRGRSF